MAVEKIERTFENQDDDQLFAELRKAIADYVERFSLSEEVDEAGREVRVKRVGFAGRLGVKDRVVRVELDYAFLVPSPVRKRITQGVASALDDMAKADAAKA